MAQQQQKPQRRDTDRRDSNDQSGSTGRNPGVGDSRHDGVNTGQGRYGQSGGTNKPEPNHDTGSSGTSDYGRSDDPDQRDDDRPSNPGSGRADRDETQKKGKEPPKGPFKHRDDNENPG
ncbi:MAG TPA: hypothetical protein VMF52_05150 [Steroidobacteraceae bacterium]|nr:hypothetical protein [Steroidobacteraceae bacterium]